MYRSDDVLYIWRERDVQHFIIPATHDAQELDLLEDEASVFKLIGPVLMKQDLEEAKQNVAKRLELIEREMCVRVCVCL